MVDKKKSQHMNFSHEALPILFHSQYTGFMQYLDRDRTKFLEFWWKHIGDQLDKSLCKSPNGLNYQIRDFEGGKKLVLITLPPPERNGEAYFLACIKLPEKRVPLLKIPTTRVISLYKTVDAQGQDHTWLAYVTPQARIVSIGEGPQPDSEAFITAVRKIMKL